jgi:hypothetical protein
MVRSVVTFFALFIFTAFSAAAIQQTVQAQERSYSSPKGDYTVDLPSPTWRLVDEPDDVHQHTEFVYVDRNDGYLRIRKEPLEQGLTITEFANRDQDQKTRFLPGYVNGKEEPFSGRLTGVTISYEFTQAGKPMVGRSYYLQGDSSTVYVLRFTGQRDKLARLRNQTDFIARSLRLK